MPAVTVRPPTPADAEAVLAVILARDVADLGRPDFTLGDLTADWAHPELDLARDAWIVEEAGGAVSGYALLYESVGMTVDSGTDRWEKVLGDA